MKLADEIRAMITGFPKPLDADNAPYSEGFITATTKAAELVEKHEAYERKAAEMHEELVELLSSIPCIKCGISTECRMSTKIGAIYDAIKRAKAL